MPHTGSKELFNQSSCQGHLTHKFGADFQQPDDTCHNRMFKVFLSLSLKDCPWLHLKKIVPHSSGFLVISVLRFHSFLYKSFSVTVLNLSTLKWQVCNWLSHFKYLLRNFTKIFNNLLSIEYGNMMISYFVSSNPR